MTGRLIQMTFKKAFLHKITSECLAKFLNRRSIKLALPLFLSFYTVKVLAAQNGVQNGQIFWEIRKLGVKPGYILGLNHSRTLDENSLPPEINTAINNSQIGLIELSAKERTEKKMIEAKQSIGLFLPESETLSSYLGEQKAREVFEFLQDFLLNRDEEGFLVNKIQTLYGIDVTSYETVNHLTPFFIMQIIQELFRTQHIPLEQKSKKLEKLLAKLNGDSPEQVTFDCSLKTGKQMDLFIEKALVCEGKGIYSIETAEIQIRALYFNRNHHEESRNLHALLSAIVQREKGNQSEMDIIIEEWGKLFAKIIKRLSKHIANQLFQNIPIDVNPETEQILDFLSEKQCADLPINRVKEYMDLTLQLYQLSFHYTLKATQIEEETAKRNIAPIVEKLYETGTDVFASCFPDYKPAMSKEETMEWRTSAMWNSIQHEREQLINPRDKSQALFLLPYLEEGGVFAAVGAGHLKGVLRELEAKGWQVRAVPLSHPIREAQNEDSEAKTSENASDQSLN